MRRQTGVPQILKAFTQRLGTDAVVRSIEAPTRDDSQRIEIRVGRKKHRLRAHWVGMGWPERTREVLQRLRQPWPRNHVLVARQFSDATRAMLRRRNANWLDQTGQARIVTPSGLLILSGVTIAAKERRKTTRWTPASADVAEVILAVGNVPSVKEISKLTGWQQPAVSKALRFLDAQGWTRKAGSSRGIGAYRTLVEMDGLRESWAEYVAAEPKVQLFAHALMRDPLNFLEEELAPALHGVGRYAVSGWAGLQLLAPFVTSVPVIHSYIEAPVYDSELSVILKRLKVREVSEGARIVFWRARPAVFTNPRVSKRSGRPVVVTHVSRLYADLLTLGDRGKEAAEHVRVELLPSQRILSGHAKGDS